MCQVHPSPWPLEKVLHTLHCSFKGTNLKLVFLQPWFLPYSQLGPLLEEPVLLVFEKASPPLLGTSSGGWDVDEVTGQMQKPRF